MKLCIFEWTDTHCEPHREAIIGPSDQAEALIRNKPDFLNIVSIKVISIDNYKIIG